MKLKIILILAIILVVIGCEEKGNKVEILNNPELNYFTDEEVDTPAILTKDDWQKENSEVLAIGEAIRQKNSNFPDKIALNFRIFVSNEGEVVAIKNLKKPNQETKIIENEFLKKFAELLSGKIDKPAQKNGASVNYRKDFKIGFETFNDSLRIFLPDFLTSETNLRSPNYDQLIEKDFFTAVEEMPKPIGGINAIAQNVRYPDIAKRAGIEGRVFVKALIDETGSVVGTSIIRGIGAGCDQAAMEAVMQSKFKPGRQKGKPVKVQVTIPILFKLQ
jgi:TonB family protein